MFYRLKSYLLALGILIAAMSQSRADSSTIVCSFTILENLSRKMLINNDLTYSIVPINGELHHYQLSAQDVVRLNKASLVIGFSPDSESWLKDWEKASPGRRVVWLAGGKDEQRIQPHGWTDPSSVKTMLKRLRVAMLAANLPPAATEDRVLEEIDEVDRRLSQLFHTVPPGKRAIITQHPNLDPFAERYGLKVVGTLLASPSGEAADTSARHYSTLLKSIRTNDVRAVFVDEGQNQDLALRLTRDAGLPPPVALNIESLSGPEGQARSWKEMMLHNGRLIHEALTR
ncbi:MAG: hypothetical protein RJA37_441 [Verrucomicrobiota bacterium]|jgi:zinc/manganese transport system substrate-binding protein